MAQVVECLPRKPRVQTLEPHTHIHTHTQNNNNNKYIFGSFKFLNNLWS
jgi:hypothetical protein